MLKSCSPSYTIKQDSLDAIREYWHPTEDRLDWNCLFVLPAWLQLWKKHFGNASRLFIVTIRHAGRPIGIAPLWAQDKTVRLIGESEVCDYLDFVVVAEKAPEFYRLLLDYLKREGIARLQVAPVRSDSSVFAALLPVAEEMGCKIVREPIGVSFALELPSSWDHYLELLSGKERHEIRRKFRRLYEAGDIRYRAVDEISAVRSATETFIALFRSNRRDKAAFMNQQMNLFFHDLALELARDGILRLFFLELGGKAIASVMCFDYRSTMYLYNNGYDLRYRALSPGLLCKVLSIKESIQSGKKTYDLLKGSEAYKHRLGGKPIPLYRCDIDLQ
jgi:CelD/BcsL family acetyltransferase involved in cellulose biosynthesis